MIAPARRPLATRGLAGGVPPGTRDAAHRSGGRLTGVAPSHRLDARRRGRGATGIANGVNEMKLSARNQLRGTILEITKGATTSHVRLDVGGTTITASITNEAVDDLGLEVGAQAYAVVKASDVMVAVD